jgi:hypothetical protein
MADGNDTVGLKAHSNAAEQRPDSSCDQRQSLSAGVEPAAPGDFRAILDRRCRCVDFATRRRPPRRVQVGWSEVDRIWTTTRWACFRPPPRLAACCRLSVTLLARAGIAARRRPVEMYGRFQWYGSLPRFHVMESRRPTRLRSPWANAGRLGPSDLGVPLVHRASWPKTARNCRPARSECLFQGAGRRVVRGTTMGLMRARLTAEEGADVDGSARV